MPNMQVTATDLSNRAGEILEAVISGAVVTVNRYGRPVATIHRVHQAEESPAKNPEGEAAEAPNTAIANQVCGEDEGAEPRVNPGRSPLK